MNKKVGVAFAVLLGLVTTSSYISDFQIIPGRDVPIYLCVILTVGMLMLLNAKLGIWLKLLLLFVLANPIFAMNSTEACLCVGGIVSFYGAYLFLIRFHPYDIEQLLKLLPILGAIQALWIIMERIHYGNWSFWFVKGSNFVGTIGYPNLAGLFVACTLPFMWMYRKKLCWLALPALIYARSKYTGFVILFSIAMLFWKKYRVLFVIFALATVLIIPMGVKRLATPGGRLMTWQDAMVEIKKSPWVGSGFGSYKVLKHSTMRSEFGRYPVTTPTPFSVETPTGEHYEYVRTYHPHNLFLRVWREAGIFCALAVLIFIISTVVDFLRSEKTSVQRAVFVSSSGLHVGAMFSFPERSIGIAALWVVLMAAHQVLIRRRI